jgi:hypothetical protein
MTEGVIANNVLPKPRNLGRRGEGLGEWREKLGLGIIDQRPKTELN